MLSTIFDGLNDAQAEAVDRTEGPLLVLAGAGTGKTRVVTRRIAHLLARGVPASSILALTFTRRAAEEMKLRLAELVGPACRRATVCTFHSLGFRILREQRGEHPEIDFEDMIRIPLEMLQRDEGLRAGYHRRWTHLLVDEYQDTNDEQYHLLRTLLGPGRNLCVVGDDDQSIYGFRGANVGRILGFQDDFAGAARVTLEENYRSCGQVVALANSVIAPAPRRFDKRLRASARIPGWVCCKATRDEHAEADWVASRIARLHRARQVPFSDVAILVRARSFASAVTEELRNKGVPLGAGAGVSVHDAARGQGPRVPRGVPARRGGRLPAARIRAGGGPGRGRGRAEAALRGHHPGTGGPLPDDGLEARREPASAQQVPGDGPLVLAPTEKGSDEVVTRRPCLNRSEERLRSG